MIKKEFSFHILVLCLITLMCFIFLFTRARNFDKNYPNPIPLVDNEKVN